MVLSDEEQQKVEKFESKSVVSPKVGVVYGIYDKEGDCLYIGQTGNFISRFDNHYHHTDGKSNIASLLDENDVPSVDEENLWEDTRIKYVIEEDEESRKRIESLLIHRNDPKLNQNKQN